MRLQVQVMVEHRSQGNQGLAVRVLGVERQQGLIPLPGASSCCGSGCCSTSSCCCSW